jgi:hypothetical protein
MPRLVADESSGDVDIGELTGEVEISSGEGVFAYNRGMYDQCRIMMKFAPDKIELEQTQQCGFGTGVDASGTYAKISSEVPNLSDVDDQSRGVTLESVPLDASESVCIHNV